MSSFSATIYKNGINACVDVPREVTATMIPVKGYIRVKGTINGFAFAQTLVPVKNAPYRLFVNIPMLKGGKTAIGENAAFDITQDHDYVPGKAYPMPELLQQALEKQGLLEAFYALSGARQKDILKYLDSLKTEVTVQKNIDKLIGKMQEKKDVRIP